MRRVVVISAATGLVGALIGGAMALRFRAAAPQPVARVVQPLAHYQALAELQRLRAELQELQAENRALQRAAPKRESAAPTQPCPPSAHAEDAVDPAALTRAAPAMT